MDNYGCPVHTLPDHHDLLRGGGYLEIAVVAMEGNHE
jgi:hypothetical protein